MVKLNVENVLIVSCLHCFETPTGLQAKDSKSQWKSVCRRVKSCKFRFHYISNSSYQELPGKELIWCGSGEKKNLFADPVCVWSVTVCFVFVCIHTVYVCV